MVGLVTLLLYLKLTITLDISNPSRLEDMSIDAVKNTIEDDITLRIFERIYSNIFNNEQSLTRSGFMNVFLNNTIPLKSIDLSSLEIVRIPSSIVERISGLEILDLSNNPDIKLNEEWFKKLIEKNRIRELSLNNCRITVDDLEVIDRIETLERLNLSGNRFLDIKTNFNRTLSELKHLDISECNLNGNSLKFILENALNLKSLNFSWNGLSAPFSYLNSVDASLRRSLESLNLSYCSLISDDLEHVFVFENLREIDLSGNSFSFISSHSIRRMFIEKASSPFDNTIDNFFDYGYCLLKGIVYKNTTDFKQNIYLENLASINLENCKIRSPEFIRNIFDLENLEVLNLNGNLVGIDSVGRASNSLKRLEMSGCGYFDEISFRLITEFNCLEYLNVSENSFENMDENFTLGNLNKSLKHLNIKNSGWNMNAMKAITECHNLQYLDASFNDFNSVSDFKDLKNTLREAYFYNSNINFRFLEKLTECKAIEKLVLSRNIIDNIPVGFTLKNLENTLMSLDISHSEWNINGLKALSKCSKLRYLNASWNHFSDIGSNFSLGNLTRSLRSIDLSFSYLNHNGLIMLAQCIHLKKLNVSRNPFNELSPSFSFNTVRNSLEELEINNCGLKSSHLRAITDCRRLKILDASNNDFDNLSSRFILGISKDSLESLFLSACNLDHRSFRAVTDCRKLKKLDISNNNYEELNETTELGCSKESLIELSINACSINYSGFRTITDLPRLQKLLAASNDLTIVPDDFSFGYSKNTLINLDLSWCTLNGDGLKAVIECMRLERLAARGSIINSFPNKLNLGIIRYSLRSIDFSRSKLVSKIIDLFKECPKLENLELRNCEIERSKRYISIFEKLKNMIIVEVSD